MSQDTDLRRALLQRLADGLRVMAEVDSLDFTCCWVKYDHSPSPGRVEHHVHRLCQHSTYWEDGCRHWHHRNEIWMA